MKTPNREVLQLCYAGTQAYVDFGGCSLSETEQEPQRIEIEALTSRVFTHILFTVQTANSVHALTIRF